MVVSLCSQMFLNLLDDKTVRNGPWPTCFDGRAYNHSGFWHPMDTLRDKNMLNSLGWRGSVEGLGLNNSFWQDVRSF